MPPEWAESVEYASALRRAPYAATRAHASGMVVYKCCTGTHCLAEVAYRRGERIIRHIGDIADVASTGAGSLGGLGTLRGIVAKRAK